MPSDSSSPFHILIFEPRIEGHYSDYIRHLVQYVHNQSMPIKLTLLVHPDFKARFWDAIKSECEESHECVDLIPFGPREHALCTHNGLPQGIRSLFQWFTMMKYLRRTGAVHGHFLYIDTAQLVFALKLGAPKGRTLSGILFRSSIHYEQLWQTPSNFRQHIKNYRKTTLYKRMVKHPALSTLFSLDPYFAEYAAQSFKQGDKVQALPEPCPFPQDPATYHPSDIVGCDMPEDRTCFLLFGSLTPRKGIYQVLEALRMLDSKIAKKTAVVFAGKLRDDIRTKFQERLGQLTSDSPELWMHHEDRHINPAEITDLVIRCDVVLAPYQNHIGSSNVMLWAAGAQKPVITQEYGLMGALARDYKLGLVVDTTKPRAIADAIQTYVEGDITDFGDPKSMKQFADVRTPKQFATTIFNGILNCIRSNKSSRYVAKG